MSKSLGNLVFVSRLVADGVDPMAVRLAILAHHYRGDWDWTAEGLAAAQDRLARWREAVQVAVAAPRPARWPASPGGRRPRAAARPCWPRCGSGWPTTSTPRGRWRSWTAGPSDVLAGAVPPARLRGRRGWSGTPWTPS